VPAPEALLPSRAEMAWCVSGRATVCPEWVVAPALESSRALPSERYHPHYRPLVESVGGSEVSPSDWHI
jgi:hypothetical protein